MEGSVLTDGDCGEVEGSQLLSDLFECVAVGRVAAEPEAAPSIFVRPKDGPAAPERLEDITYIYMTFTLRGVYQFYTSLHSKLLLSEGG